MKPFTKQFPTDIWVVIIEHLQIPPPLPLSRPTGRQAFQQPHLAVLMRTAKFVSAIAERLLYTHIYTDRLFDVVLHYNSPSPGKRFAFTKSLHLEYMARDEEPTYLAICNSGRKVPIWKLFGRVEGLGPLARKVQAGRELSHLQECLNKLCDMGGIVEAFPRLETVAVDAIKAVGARIWREHEQTWERVEDSYALVKTSMDFNTFLSSGNLRAVCVRGTCGPYSFEAVSFDSQLRDENRSVTFTPTVHFSSETTHLMLPLGYKSQWISDEPLGSDLADVLLALGRCTREAVVHRTGLVTDHWTGKGQPQPLDTADVDIYCTTNQYSPNIYSPALDQVGLNPFEGYPTGPFTEKVMTPVEKAAMVKILQRKVQELFRKGSKMEDKFRWHVSEDTPTCLACGTGVPPV